MNRTIILVVVTLAALVWAACKKGGPENPYEDIVRPAPSQNPSADQLPEGSFAWLHAKVFKPTCANSGCHDGTFEPEFRTIASSYNSLVNQPVIANDPANSFVHRVVPGNATQSWLHERMTTFVENTSGIMPLTTEPTSDWEANKATYIARITQWINDGAKDMFGNPAPPAEANMPPQLFGLAVFPHNNTSSPYPRDENNPFGLGEILVPAGLVDVWIFPVDDNAGVNQFASCALKVSDDVSNFSNATEYTFGLSGPIIAQDFGQSFNQFYYKTTIDLSGAPTGAVRYLRTYLNDGVQTNPTEIPNAGSEYFWLLVFSLKVV